LVPEEQPSLVAAGVSPAVVLEMALGKRKGPAGRPPPPKKARAMGFFLVAAGVSPAAV